MPIPGRVDDDGMYMQKVTYLSMTVALERVLLCSPFSVAQAKCGGILT